MLDHQHCAAGVDDKGPIPDGGVHMFDSHVTQDFFALRCCGIIMKDVQATMTVLHKTVELADGLFVRNVEVPRISISSISDDCGGPPLRTGKIYIPHYHLSPFLPHTLGRGAPYPPPPGHHRH